MVAGKHEVRLNVRSPSGRVAENDAHAPIALQGDGHGFNLTIQLNLNAGEWGLHWGPADYDRGAAGAMTLRP